MLPQVPRRRYLLLIYSMIFFSFLVIYQISKYSRMSVLEVNDKSVKSKKLKDHNSLAGYDKHIIVHIDLKGAPPKMSYLKTFLKLIKDMGATGILVEYEDMFPFTGELVSLSAYNAYTSMEVNELYSYAKELKLEFIPLVQTFGHLEFMLKLKEFSHLREVPGYPLAICPSNNGSLPILQKMIAQITKLHPGIKRLHIGSDEVFQLGQCDSCQNQLVNKDWSKDNLFISHVAEVIKYVRTFNIVPIMWDDMLRKVPMGIISSAGLQNTVELMVWRYNSGILERIPINVWDKYAKFSSVWMASAFKGAGKADHFITDITRRIDNNKEWMAVYQMFSSSVNFNGIVLTGWQRYDHFAVLCELLPQAIPALELSIACIKSDKIDLNGTIIEVGKHLGCDGLINTDVKYMDSINHCDYPGAEVLKISQRLYMLKKDIRIMLRSNFMRGWITNYNVKYSFSSPHVVDMVFQNLTLLSLEYINLINETKKGLLMIYDKYTVNEWMFQNLYPIQNQINDLQEKITPLSIQTHWKRNPQGYNSSKTDL